MTYKLNDNQKINLASLFELSADSEDAERLFGDIEYQMEESLLPEKGSRKVIALEKAALLDEISSTSKKLSSLLARLNETLRDNIDSKLGQLGKPYLHETLKNIEGEPALYWDSISTVRAAQTIGEESALLSMMLSDNFGAGYMEKVIEVLSISWPYYLLEVPKITIDCVYVKYFGIVLEDSSHEKIYKQIKRSRWYAFQKRHYKSHR